MTALFWAVLRLSLAGTAALAAALVVRALLQGMPRRFAALLWAGVWFRFFFAGFLPIFPAKPQTLPPVPVNIAAQAMPVQTPALPLTETAPLAQNTANTVPFLSIMATVWAAVAAALLFFALVRGLRLARHMGTPDADGTVTLRGLPTAFVFGLLRPRICLPAGLDGDTRCMVLLHERAHIRFGHHILKPLLFAAACIHWFNPAVWLTFSLTARDMETACDEAAVRSTDPTTYAAALLQLAAPAGHPALSAFGRSNTERRIRHVLCTKTPSRLLRVLCALVCGALFAALLGCSASIGTTPADRETDDPVVLVDPAAPQQLLVWYDGLVYTEDSSSPMPGGSAEAATLDAIAHSEDTFCGIDPASVPAPFTNHPDWVSATLYQDGETLYLSNGESSLRLKLLDGTVDLPTFSSAAFPISLTYDDTLPYGEVTVTRAGENGRQAIYTPHVFEDGLYLYADPYSSYTRVMQAPVSEEITVGTKGAPQGLPILTDPETFVFPVTDALRTRAFSNGDNGTHPHTGVDLAAPMNTPVLAAKAGVVVFAGFDSAEWGNHIYIAHMSGHITHYAHCDKLIAETGDTVTAGQTIATVGATGNATGAHLHFEVQADGLCIDPLSLLPAMGAD